MIKKERANRPRWAGEPALQCMSADCDAVVTFVLRQANRERIGVCQTHVQELVANRVGPACTVELVDAPGCFHRSCGVKAERIIKHLDGELLPVCQQHLDDLSWVTPEAFRDEAFPELGGDRE